MKNHYVDVLPANRYLFIYLFICFVLIVRALFSIDHFHPHGQLQCQFIGTKESVYIKENS